jgi:hypothetical protein
MGEVKSMIKEGWFFLAAGLIATLSSLVDKRTPIVNDVDSAASAEEKSSNRKSTIG